MLKNYSNNKIENPVLYILHIPGNIIPFIILFREYKKYENLFITLLQI